MPEIILNLEALAHNAEAARRLAGSWGLDLLPVMKMIDGHPAAALTLHGRGFPRLAYGGFDEARRFGGPAGQREQRVMIGLTLPRRVSAVVENFGLSLQSRPDIIAALDEAGGALGLNHEILLTLDLGGGREGLADIKELVAVLDLARSLRRVKVMGLAVTVGCLDGQGPGPDFWPGLARARAVMRARGEPELISAGGSILINLLHRKKVGGDKNLFPDDNRRPDRSSAALGPNWGMVSGDIGPFPDDNRRPNRSSAELGPIRGAAFKTLITELRVGDPFFMGRDSWHDSELPGGPFRRDVLTLAGTVAEIRGGRALVDLGRFHLGDRPLKCHWPGAREIGRCAGCLILGLAPAGPQPTVGDRILFQPDYWNAAAAFRNPALPIEIIPQLPEPALPS